MSEQRIAYAHSLTPAGAIASADKPEEGTCPRKSCAPYTADCPLLTAY